MAMVMKTQYLKAEEMEIYYNQNFMSNRKRVPFTLPNILSFYRLFSFPFVLCFILAGEQTVFIVLMFINFLTDIFDGYLARKLKCETKLGARLDSLADEGMYILGLLGIWILKKNELQPYKTGLSAFAALYLVSLLVSLFKFKALPSLHLYLSKIEGYLLALFFITLFLFGFSPFLFYVTLIVGIASFAEQIIILVSASELRPDYKGLYWMLKNK
jgi:CDP-diacylglycerol--glycerol-3-phosphate 3-phosphatidyltransferase